VLIPSKHEGYQAGIRLYPCDGGGSPAPASTSQSVSQQTTTDVPAWARDYAKEQLGASSSMIFNRDDAGNITGMRPFQPYTGERTSQFAPLQQQAFQSAGQQGVAGQLGQATGIAGAAANQALGAGAGFSPYQTGQFGAQAADYMNPYMQNVVGIQQREAQRQADIAGTQRAGEAVRAGAFGGGRQAVMDAEAARNLAMQKGDIQSRGLNTAYEQAQQMFNQEQQRGEQSRQFGANLGLQGVQSALQGASTLGSLGNQQFGQQMDITQQQATMGGAQQQQMQRMLDQQYQDYMTQQRHPYEQLDWMTAQLRGVPMGSQSQVYNSQPQPSASAQLAGIGTALAGFAAARGGEVPSYAEGGITGALSDPQLQQRQQMPNISTLAKMAVEKEMMDRAQLRQGMQPPPGAAPQGTVADEMVAGLGAIPVQDDLVGMAGGGIVSFAGGGVPYSVPEMPELDRDPGVAALLAGRAEAPAGGPRIIVLPAGTSAQDRSLVEMQNPDARVTVEDSGGAFGALRNRAEQVGAERQELLQRGAEAVKQGFTYSSDVAAQQAKRAQRAPDTGDRPDALARLEARYPKPEGIAAALPATPTALPGRKASPAPLPGRSVPPAADPADSGLMATVGAEAPAGAGPVSSVRTAARSSGIAQGLGGTAAQIMAERRALAGTDKTDAEVSRLTKELSAQNIAAAKADEQALLEQQKSTVQYGADKEQRLAAQEAKIAGDEKKNFKMSLIEAGLAMMSGTSTADALVRGAQQGLAGYQKRLDRFETQREKLELARDRIEEARRREEAASGAERRLAARDVRAAENAARQAEIGMLVAQSGASQKDAASAYEIAEKRYSEERRLAAELQQERIRASNRGSGGSGGRAGGPSDKDLRILYKTQYDANQAALKSLPKYGASAEETADLKAQRAELTAYGNRVRAQLNALGPESPAATMAVAPSNFGSMTIE
jgi:hypothetical protein